MTNDFTEVNITGEYAGKTLAFALASLGYFVTADCGGRGVCGNCSVIISGERVKSCRYVVPKDGVTVSVPFEKETEKTLISGKKAVLDIGTTTIELGIVDDGKVISSIKALNPQAAHGADVLSRVLFATENLDVLHGEIVNAVGNLSEKTEAEIIYACGNPTMTHLFAGIKPENFGVSPFKSVFSDEKDAGGIKILPASRSDLPGSAFIGSDIIAGAYFANLKPGEIIVDLGTNGEMIYNSEGRYIAASSSCGPCFEGAEIECGMGGLPGAVNSAVTDRKTLSVTTIDGEMPRGICGAGLIDIISCLLEIGQISDFGYMKEDYYITDGVYVTPRDVRNFQLAKSAVRSCFEGILEEANANGVEKIYVAGGFGKYANVENMIKVGLFPESALGKIEVIGNAALKGAAKAVKYGLRGIQEISDKLTVLNTGEMKSFNENFMKYINF